MKGLGIALIACGFLLMASSLLSLIPQDGKKTARPELRAENGETMALLPLLGVVSLALGGALVTSHYVTRKR